MSIQALTWAMKATGPSAPAKFVLVALANLADDDGRCRPTVSKLCQDTLLSENTVRDSLRMLIDSRLIREDAGTTSSKHVFTLLMPE